MRVRSRTPRQRQIGPPAWLHQQSEAAARRYSAQRQRRQFSCVDFFLRDRSVCFIHILGAVPAAAGYLYRSCRYCCHRALYAINDSPSAHFPANLLGFTCVSIRLAYGSGSSHGLCGHAPLALSMNFYLNGSPLSGVTSVLPSPNT